MLSLKNLTVSASGKVILKEISYRFKKNKVYVIMGPNGSGKSTLAHAIMGNPAYTLSGSSRIVLSGKRVDRLSPDERSQKGIFLSFQTPYALQGVSVFQLLRIALTGKTDPLDLKISVERTAQALGIKQDVLERPLNQGASGGEQKKMEVLQASILNRSIVIFDEVDTGVDIDALKTISHYLNSIKKGKTFIFITHYTRILSYIRPDTVLIMKEGAIIKEGGKELLRSIEMNGYGGL